MMLVLEMTDVATMEFNELGAAVEVGSASLLRLETSRLKSIQAKQPYV